MRKPRPTAWLFPVFLCLIVVTAACSSGSGAPPEPQPGNETSVTDSVLQTPGSDFVSMLGAVPDTPETRAYVLLNDYAEAAAQGKLIRPPPQSSDTEAAGYLADMILENRLGLSTFPDFWGPSVASVEAWRTELGFSILDADRDVFAGAPEHRYRIISGRIDPADVERAVRSDSNYSDLLETAEHNGSTYFTWGPQANADLSRKSAARPVGRGGQLAVLEDRIIWTLADTEMKAALDTKAGTLPSLAEVEDFRLAASSLELAGAYTATITNGVLAAEDVVRFASAQRPEAAADIRRLQAEAGFLLPYTALGVGASLGDDGKPRAVIVFVNPDQDTAAENANRFTDIVTTGGSIFTGRRWSEVAAVDTVTTSGRLTIAVLHTSSPSYFRGLLDVVDSLLFYTTGEPLG